eukprot:1116444-Rhodomonas_salina.2
MGGGRGVREALAERPAAAAKGERMADLEKVEQVLQCSSFDVVVLLFFCGCCCWCLSSLVCPLWLFILLATHNAHTLTHPHTPSHTLTHPDTRAAHQAAAGLVADGAKAEGQRVEQVAKVRPTRAHTRTHTHAHTRTHTCIHVRTHTHTLTRAGPSMRWM